jgi:hypothetical protein
VSPATLLWIVSLLAAVEWATIVVLLPGWLRDRRRATGIDSADTDDDFYAGQW